MAGTGDIISGIGSLFASGDFSKASKYAQQDVQYEKESTALQEYIANKQIYQGMGSERVAFAAGGLKDSGSALDVLRNTAQLGSLHKSQISIQGAINEAGYAEQAAMLAGQATQTLFAGIGSIASGLTQNAEQAAMAGGGG